MRDGVRARCRRAAANRASDDAVHACRVVHRDLKPENILVATGAGGERMYKVRAACVGGPCARIALATLLYNFKMLIRAPACLVGRARADR